MIIFALFSESSSDEYLNPWEVESLEDFSFYSCSKCDFKSKEDKDYQCHILEKHPKTDSFEVKNEEDNYDTNSYEIPAESMSNSTP